MSTFWWKLGIVTALSLIGINLLIVNIVLLREPQVIPSQPQVESQRQPTVPPLACTEACKTQIQEMVNTTTQSLIASLPTPKPVVVSKQTVSSPSKEFHIPFGNGSTTSDQWGDLPGIESFIDTGNYTGIKTVYFEVSMSIPTKNGIVFARLYNVTDKHPVWFSEVSTDSNTAKLLASTIHLDEGNKQYRIQMKTSLKYHSVLDFARVKIITN